MVRTLLQMAYSVGLRHALMETPYPFQCAVENFPTEGAKFSGHGARESVRQSASYPCDLCDKEFSYKHVLKRHMQIHTGEFSYHCHICRRGFNEKGHYNSHMNKHEGKSFPCNYCSVRYSTEPSLKKHLRNVHGK